MCVFFSVLNSSYSLKAMTANASSIHFSLCPWMCTPLQVRNISYSQSIQRWGESIWREIVDVCFWKPVTTSSWSASCLLCVLADKISSFWEQSWLSVNGKQMNKVAGTEQHYSSQSAIAWRSCSCTGRGEGEGRGDEGSKRESKSSMFRCNHIVDNERRQHQESFCTTTNSMLNFVNDKLILLFF